MDKDYIIMFMIILLLSIVTIKNNTPNQSRVILN